MSNYPDDVTGNELAIAGPDYEQEYPEPCPDCDGLLMEFGYRHRAWVTCTRCQYSGDIQPEEGSND
jgi:hypothetical protein